MTLLKNLGLFLLVFLPLVALVSMVLAGVMGDPADVADEWYVGWSPILWFIMTAPWLLPTVLVVPILHFLGRALAKRTSPRSARSVVLVASPVLFLLAVLGLWGPHNLEIDFVFPVLAAAFVYGAVLRIAKPTGHGDPHGEGR